VVGEREDVHLQEAGSLGQALGQLVVQGHAGDDAAEDLAVVAEHVDHSAGGPVVLARQELVARDQADVAFVADDSLRGRAVLVGERPLDRGRAGDALRVGLGAREGVGKLLAADAKVGGQARVDRVPLLALGDLARGPGGEDDDDRCQEQRPERQSEPTAGRSRCKSRQRCRRFSFLPKV
jgi:hypothetical protein